VRNPLVGLRREEALIPRGNREHKEPSAETGLSKSLTIAIVALLLIVGVVLIEVKNVVISMNGG
jgi:hypothetical protein